MKIAWLERLDNETVTVCEQNQIKILKQVSLSKVTAASDSDALTDWVSDTDSGRWLTEAGMFDSGMHSMDWVSDTDWKLVSLVLVDAASVSEIPRIGILKRTLIRTHWVKLSLILRCLLIGFLIQNLKWLTKEIELSWLWRPGFLIQILKQTHSRKMPLLTWSAYWLGFLDTDSGSDSLEVDSDSEEPLGFWQILETDSPQLTLLLTLSKLIEFLTQTWNHCLRS